MLTKLHDLLFVQAYAQGVTGSDFLNKFTFQRSSGSATGIFSGLVGKVLVWVLAIIALIAFFYLIFSGVKYITSGGDAAKATEARNGIINAIIGIIVVVLAYVILQFAFKAGDALIN